MTLTDDAPGGASATIPSTALVVPEAPLSTGPVVSFTAGVNVPFSGVVANFVDADPNAVAGDYSISINWGDASSSGGFATQTGVSGAGVAFSVSGNHTYTAACTCTLTITIFETDNPGITLVISTTTGQVVVPATSMSLVSSNNPGYLGQKITYSAVVSAVPPAQELGQPTGTVTFKVDNVVVGTATLSNGHANLAIMVPRGLHTVTATYPGNGVFLGSSASLQERIYGITANGVGTITGVHGSALTGVAVATFTDDKPGTSSFYYTATISWGDTTSSTGFISVAGGVFTVRGTHTYAAAGNFTITVTITAADGRVVTTTSSAHIT